jgi:hypothetical protein
MKPTTKSTMRIKALRFTRSRTLKAIALATAALPLFQTTGCYPDPAGALNFQLQLLITTTFVTAFNTFVMNVLHI